MNAPPINDEITVNIIPPPTAAPHPRFLLSVAGVCVVSLSVWLVVVFVVFIVDTVSDEVSVVV